MGWVKPVTLWWSNLEKTAENYKAPSWMVGVEVTLILVLAVIILLPVNPSNMPYASPDSGVFLYTGWRILHGEIPYKDVWDHKTPIIFYLDAFGLLLGGGTVWGVWCIEVLSLFVAMLFSYFLLKRLFNISTSAVITTVWAANLLFLIAGGNLTTEYTLPLQFASMWLFYQWQKNDGGIEYPFWVGVLGGFEFLTRQNAVGMVFSIVVVLIIYRWRTGMPQKLFHELICIFIGGFIPVAIFTIYFAYNGALADFWSAAFVYNFFYSVEADMGDRLNALVEGFWYISNTGLSWLGLFGWGIAVVALLRSEIPRKVALFVWVIVLDFVIELILVSLPGRPRIPYFMAILSSFAICAGFAYWLFLQVFIWIKAPILFSRLLNGFLLMSFIALQVQPYQQAFFLSHEDNLMVNKIINCIDENSNEDDAVLVWGSDAYINFHAQRKSPTRFVYQLPLFRTEYAGASMLNEFFQDVLSNKPRLIFFANDKKKITPGFGKNKTSQSEVIVDELKKLYEPKTCGNGIDILEYAGP